ncbi:MAG: aminoglycoside phosphotransferase family protein [Candidatus Limnocylindrales bacterium]
MVLSTLPFEVAAGVTAILGDDASVVEELTPPWVTTTRSVLVGTGDPERRLVLQWLVSARAGDRRAIDRRLRLGPLVARRAPWLPLPEVVGGDTDGPTPYVITRFVPGISGREMLGNDASAALIGAAIGGLARELARVPTAGLRLSPTWSDSDRLRAAALRWLGEAGPSIGSVAARRVQGVIERLPDGFLGVRPVFAHGDLAPVNVLMGDDAVVALLDLERARLAHRLFDPAWLRFMIRYHHPSRWPAAGGAFLTTAGIDQDAGTLGQLNMLAALQCLEMLAATPRRRLDTRREWADRVVQVLDWGRD